MSDPPSLDDLLRALRRVHRGVLATLFVCALVVVSVADPADDGGLQATDPRFTLTALALGVASIVARGKAASPRPRSEAQPSVVRGKAASPRPRSEAQPSVVRGKAAAPRTGGMQRVVFAIVGMLLAGSIGLVAVALAWIRDEREAALLYVLGGAILALRGPAGGRPA